MAENKRLDELTAATSAAEADNLLLQVGTAARKITLALLRKSLLKLAGLDAITTAVDTDLIAIDDGPGTPKKMTIANAKTLFAGTGATVLYAQEQQASGTHAGGSSATTWNPRELNTSVVNTISGASLSSGDVVLPAGTYDISAFSGAIEPADHRLRLRNTTDGATVLSSVQGFSGAGSEISGGTLGLQGRFTLAAQKTLQLQHYTESAKATNGLGNAAATGEVEVYAEIFIQKVG